MAVDILSGIQRIGILKQTNWATPQAASANFQKMPYNRGVTKSNPDIQIDDFQWTSKNGIHHEYERSYTDAVSGLPSINFSGDGLLPILAPHFYASCHAVTEAATTPFKKVFTMGGLTGAIDFAGNSGILHTVATDSIVGSDGELLKNAILNEFTFSIDLNARGISKLPKISGVWVGNEMLTLQNLSGAWVALPTTGFFNGENAGDNTWSLETLTLGSDSINTALLRYFERSVKLNLAADRVGGVAVQYKIMPEITYKLRFAYNSTTYKAFSNYATGARVNFKIQNAVAPPEVKGGIDFTCPYGKLIANPCVYDVDYRAIELSFRAYSNAGATPDTVTLYDAVNWAY